MPRKKALIAVAVLPLAAAVLPPTQAGYAASPTVVDPSLAVRTVASGLVAPTNLAFLGPDDMLVTEKTTGRVQRVTNGAVSTVLDLAVNSNSERGLLGMALHPGFPATPWVYLFWTQSSTGADSTVAAEVPMLGNRVDRFVWNGSTLTQDRAIIATRSRQNDATNVNAAGQVVERGNHNGGKIAFGPDGKLYIELGDQGRRGQLQNLADGPGCVTALPCPAIPAGNQPDDQHGGPEPDNAHLTGAILRLNDDGSAPTDNPFYAAGTERGGEVGANWQKVFAYGVRNAFGFAFDPISGDLWDSQNGDDSFAEINRVPAGSNLGWVQTMGPLARQAQYRAIESAPPFAGLQQTRWDPANVNNVQSSPELALERMFKVTVGGTTFKADLSGSREVPVNSSAATGEATFVLLADGSLKYRLEVANIADVRMAHIHLGGPGQNGPIAVNLFNDPAGVTVDGETRIAEGRITPADVIARAPGFDGSMAELLRRIKQGRAYVNVHTAALPGGEIRGQLSAVNGRVLSHYQDPALSWKYELAPIGLGFQDGNALGSAYHGDLFVGAARNVLLGGQIFKIDLNSRRTGISSTDKRLHDKVADNTEKYGITESETLLFGQDFGVATDIRTGPNGNLYVVSNNLGDVYEIYRK
ncbi:PQQ-dependent sugar dehydrogenase [Motilibacter aurantiacus]|uniref:PQQ-dependent sugar dehydrogenase n=1 Tax=Motilibacter aurantiacus TaxID=2714955 RepID=UPI00140A35DF|nr:PQQ-dependent sugar dehydrogenase [Motilibacter aurantiacus]NHC45388.1 CHRD domain-containing protein [Motilibacter aurantiacus]